MVQPLQWGTFSWISASGMVACVSWKTWPIRQTARCWCTCSTLYCQERRGVWFNLHDLSSVLKNMADSKKFFFPANKLQEWCYQRKARFYFENVIEFGIHQFVLTIGGHVWASLCFHCTGVTLISKPRHLLICRKSKLVCRKARGRQGEGEMRLNF